MPTYGRRRFLHAATLTGAAIVGAGALPSIASAAPAPKTVGGRDLFGWETVVGDGVWAPADAAAVGDDDVATVHHGTHSTLQANMDRRGVMAHNVTFTRVRDLETIDGLQTASAEFRLPVMPSTQNWTWNAQTLEAGLFVWDGADTRLDYGLAVQWLINPWLDDFGSIRVWHQVDGGPPEWVPVGYLKPDTEWHTFEFMFKPTTGPAKLKVDGKSYDIHETFTTKHDDWGKTIDGRFQLEIVSVWPHDHTDVPAHSAEFRNWSWRQP